jgi:hypothetical protein
MQTKNIICNTYKGTDDNGNQHVNLYLNSLPSYKKLTEQNDAKT